jgi:pimeloyl-ACP methyl ester carboxylesterase
MDSRIVETAGGRTKIRVHEGGDGPPLCFLPGAGGLFPNDAFAAALATRFRVAVPILPGYEDSEGADNLRTMLDVTLWAFDALASIGLERPILVGHSMGGMIAAEMAAVCPNEVERLVLIAPAGLWLDAHPIPDLFAALPFELPQLLFHDVALGVKLLTGGLPLDEMKAAVEEGGGLRLSLLLARFEDTGFLQRFLIDSARRLGMAGKLLFPIPERGLAERLYRVRAKTTLVWGDGDRLIVPAYAEAWQRALPHARLVRVAQAGHMVPYEKPDTVLDAIAAIARESQR